MMYGWILLLRWLCLIVQKNHSIGLKPLILTVRQHVVPVAMNLLVDRNDVLMIFDKKSVQGCVLSSG